MTDFFKKLVVETGIGTSDARLIIATAPKRYKHYYIPKRTEGRRLIAQPSRELKALQRFLIDNYLKSFPVHKSAMAYVVGRNIFQNAQVHRKSSVILKMDFSNFFPSLKTQDWRNYLEKHKPAWDDFEREAITRLLFWGEGSLTPRCLSIGAPTSPLISNLLMYDLDVVFTNLSQELAVSYTRYADDMTISGESFDSVVAFEKKMREVVGATKSPSLQFNEDKRGVYSTAQRRMVTGLVVTPERKISIGRERKRAISALLHKFSLNQISIDDVSYLKGMIGFAIANEPEFIGRMRKKYGNEVMDGVLGIRIPSRKERAASGFDN